MSDLYAVLVHYPIVNKEGRIVTTSVTNFDLHDLARNGKTFGVRRLFILTPSEAQIEMVRYIRNYWQDGYGGVYNPDRKDALEILQPVKNIEEAQEWIRQDTGKEAALVATTARETEGALSYSQMRTRLEQNEPNLLAFGTGFGLAAPFLNQADFVLEPIRGDGDYNHLPVRSAVAIILDRLVNGAR